MPVGMSDAARASYDLHMSRGGIKLGRVFNALHDKGGDDLIAWLARDTPKGGELMGTIASILLDAMYEEHDQQAKES